MTRPRGVLNPGPPALQADALTNTPWRRKTFILCTKLTSYNIFATPIDIFPVDMLSGRKWLGAPQKNSFSNFYSGVGIQYAVSRHMVGGPRAKQYAVSRLMFENLPGPTIVFDPITCRLEHTSIGCYSTSFLSTCR